MTVEDGWPTSSSPPCTTGAAGSMCRSWPRTACGSPTEFVGAPPQVGDCAVTQYVDGPGVPGRLMPDTRVACVCPETPASTESMPTHPCPPSGTKTGHERN